ncbi:hypothetical protein O181_013376 [Austropuccinia psidii MF-1]|uniref:Uncharacterized protein n=1 Tax=Austropuccinia psidii MF-1 TaxID=1389203 RepID=A0A9Q3BZK9_9BASI|nr:hypothetical protein [Austropuccinia psidii MF-1]
MPSEPAVKGKGKRHSESLIKAKNWTPIGTQRSRKPQNSASIQGKPTLTTCTGKITVINPVIILKGKLPKSVDKIFLKGTVKGTFKYQGTSQRTEKACSGPEDLEGDTLDTVMYGLEGYGVSSSAPPTHQRLFPMDHGQQGVQSNIKMSRMWSKVPEDMSERDTLKGFMAPADEWPIVSILIIPGSFQDKTRIQGQKQDFFQPKAGRVRHNDPEAVGIGERSTQKPVVAVNTSRISIPNDRNVTPPQNEHSVVTPESNLNSDSQWLQSSLFAELQESHERMQTLTASMDKIVKTLQEGHAQLRKTSEETNKRLKQVLEEQYHFRRDRNSLNKDLNQLFNVYQNMKRHPQGYGLDNAYHQEDIKPESLF